MKVKEFDRRIILIGVFLISFLFLAIEPAPIKIKVGVDNASVKATPEIGGKTLAKLPLNTILEAEEKTGEWYRVSLEVEGIQISGFIHEMLVEVYKEEGISEKGPEIRKEAEISQAEVVAEIELRMEENRTLIRQEKNLEKTINALRPLIAKTFKISDNKRQKNIATEIYLWMGLAYAGEGDAFSALGEFRNMFEVDHSYAKEITRNIYDPELIGLIEHAEKQYLGLVSEYTLEIATQPKEAKIKIDGNEIGLSPEVYRTSVPKFTIEIEKEGYKTIKEEIFLTQTGSKKEYVLESLGRRVVIKSDPPGARVYLDGEDTDQVTNCQLPFIKFGQHRISLTKKNYASWEELVVIEEGLEPVFINAIMTAKNYGLLKKWGGPDTPLFESPTGIAIDKDDNFYVVDKSDVKVKKFDSEGKLLLDWGERGKEFKILKIPAGIAVDSQSYLYVTDVKNHSVMKFDRNGKFIQKWGEEGDEEQDFRIPLGIAVDQNNDIYVVDSANNRIKKYSHRGVLKKTWGKRGASNGHFIFPAAVAVNQKNEVFVADRARIQKFSAEGEFIATWGKPGYADGELNRPMGIFIDQYNYVYVTDSANDRIQKFDENGKFITAWGSEGAADGQMNFPYGIALESGGNVLVVERNNNRVQQFGVLTQEDTQ